MKRIIIVAAGTLVLSLAACAESLPELTPLPPLAEYVPTEADHEELQRQLDMYRDSYGLTREETDWDVVRWVDYEEADEVFGECMATLGFPPGSDNSFNAADGQLEQMNLASLQCMAEYPVRGDLNRPYNEDELKVIRHHWETEYLPCLEEEGYTGIELPSFETMRAEMDAHQPFTFSTEVYNLIMDSNSHLSMTQQSDEHSRVSAACPFFPENLRAIQD